MPLRVIAAANVEPRGLLLVSKRAAPHVFYLPGGKPEPGESALACLRREVREELEIPEVRRRGLVQTDVPRTEEAVLCPPRTRTTIAAMPHARRQ